MTLLIILNQLPSASFAPNFSTSVSLSGIHISGKAKIDEKVNNKPKEARQKLTGKHLWDRNELKGNKNDQLIRGCQSSIYHRFFLNF